MIQLDKKHFASGHKCGNVAIFNNTELVKKVNWYHKWAKALQRINDTVIATSYNTCFLVWNWQKEQKLNEV